MISLLALLVGAIVNTASARATQLTVKVLNVSRSSGVVRVALCRDSEWQGHNCAFGASTQASAGVVQVVLDVPAGIYGVLVHHDVNNDGRVNQNWLGIPIEGVAFSRDADVRFGFPSFSAVSLPIDGASAMIAVSLLFEPRAK